ncbi:MAG: translation initiation factor IF-2 subunit gamma [Candidatus Pacearchaeota archaeon]|nr:MAG: translation initiation factor IF-2 subunit gamma [Candidatus Pacearchaeota archaeon]
MEELPEINVGVIGHIDHGKTTLLSKLTGKFTDTHSEELKRGITIKLGYTEMTIYKDENSYNNKGKGKPVRYVSFIDNPGHEMLMATMLSGTALIDVAMLVIAANEGIKPQTREHFMALQAKKIKKLVIIQNKIDLVSKEQAFENYKEIKEFVKGTFAENAPIIPVSALQEVNLDKIIEFLAEVEIPKRDLDSDPLFFVARSFDVNKPGTNIKDLKGGVLGGVLKKGTLKVGDVIEIKPGLDIKKPHGKVEYKTIKTKILSLYKGTKKVDKLTPGVSASIETNLDPSLTKSDALVGNVVSLEGKLPEISNKIKISSVLFKEYYDIKETKKIEPIKIKEFLMLSVNTKITVGIVEKIQGNIIEISLNIPVVAIKGESVSIARNIDKHWRLIGYGEIL